MEKAEGPENHAYDLHSILSPPSFSSVSLSSKIEKEKKLVPVTRTKSYCVFPWAFTAKKKKSNSVQHFLFYLLSLQLKIKKQNDIKHLN